MSGNLSTSLAALALVAATIPACSVRRYAVNQVGNALASGGSTYERDEDPDLVGEALPFGLKLIESLLSESPRHKGLLLAATSGFTEYSYAFVEQQADAAAGESLDRSRQLRARARRLYLRAHGYGIRGLQAIHPGVAEELDQDPETALRRMTRKDVPLLFWTAASLGLAISASRDDPEMIAQLPVVEATVRRVMELDDDWGDGAVHEFQMSLENIRVGRPLEEKLGHMRQQYERGLSLSKGTRASLFVSFAENSCIPSQNRAEFQSLLEKALAVDTDRQPEGRLANLIAQRRARWLLGRVDELFLDATPAKQ